MRAAKAILAAIGIVLAVLVLPDAIPVLPHLDHLPVVAMAVVPAVDVQSFSIVEFCRRNSISRSHYYGMRKLGIGPREMRVLSRVLITKAAETDWQREREAVTGQPAA